MLPVSCFIQSSYWLHLTCCIIFMFSVLIVKGGIRCSSGFCCAFANLNCYVKTSIVIIISKYLVVVWQRTFSGFLFVFSAGRILFFIPYS